MGKLPIPFYLTGGTALSRFYFNHRYSDDLDFFVNNNTDFHKFIKQIFITLEKEFSLVKEKTKLFDTFAQTYIKENETLLKIDLVNDIEQKFGTNQSSSLYVEIDNLRNILSNKISALFRFEPKDIADILAIAEYTIFNWKELIFEAKEKELGVEPTIIADIIYSFPPEKLKSIKWISNKNINVKPKLETIANEILSGVNNSLCKTNLNIDEAKIRTAML